MRRDFASVPNQMATAESELDELGDQAKALYEGGIRSAVEPKHRGKYLVLDVDSGEYEIDERLVAASDRAAAKHPKGRFFSMRIGYPALGRIGFRGPRVG